MSATGAQRRRLSGSARQSPYSRPVPVVATATNNRQKDEGWLKSLVKGVAKPIWHFLGSLIDEPVEPAPETPPIAEEEFKAPLPRFAVTPMPQPETPVQKPMVQQPHIAKPDTAERKRSRDWAKTSSPFNPEYHKRFKWTTVKQQPRPESRSIAIQVDHVELADRQPEAPKPAPPKIHFFDRPSGGKYSTPADEEEESDQDVEIIQVVKPTRPIIKPVSASKVFKNRRLSLLRNALGDDSYSPSTDLTEQVNGTANGHSEHKILSNGSSESNETTAHQNVGQHTEVKKEEPKQLNGLLPETPKPNGFAFGAQVENEELQKTGFKFGAMPEPTKAVDTKPSGFSFGEVKKDDGTVDANKTSNGFTFPTAEVKTLAQPSGFKFGNTAKAEELAGFKFGAPATVEVTKDLLVEKPGGFQFPPIKIEEPKNEPSTSKPTGFQFGVASTKEEPKSEEVKVPSLGFKFDAPVKKVEEPEVKKEANFKFGNDIKHAESKVVETRGFVFGSSAPSTETKKDQTAGFVFGSNSVKKDDANSGFNFGSNEQKPIEDKSTATKPAFSFGAPAKVEDKPAETSKSSTLAFSFGAPVTKPADTSSFNFGTPSKPSGIQFGTPVPTSTTADTKDDDMAMDGSPPIVPASQGFSFGGGIMTANTSAPVSPVHSFTGSNTTLFGGPATTTIATSSFALGQTPATQPPTSGFSFGSSAPASVPTSSFSFGQAPATSAGGFAFGQSAPSTVGSSSFNFGAPATQMPSVASFNQPSQQATSGFSFQSTTPQANGFQFGNSQQPAPATPQGAFQFGGGNAAAPQFNMGQMDSGGARKIAQPRTRKRR